MLATKTWSRRRYRLLSIPSSEIYCCFVQTVTPLQSANFLFHLDSEDGPGEPLITLG